MKVAGKYGKKYIWCMVNKEAKIAVYFYDDGSRGRQVLRDFFGKTEIDALRSDGSFATSGTQECLYVSG